MKKITVIVAVLMAGIMLSVTISPKVFAAESLLDAVKELVGSISEEISGVVDNVVSDIVIKPSPDKYTWYVQNYVGKNAASVGYTSLGGDRMEAYGAGHIQINFVTDNGAYIDISDENLLKQYVVKAQSLEPNTEIKYTFQVDSEGNEYNSLVDFQNIDEIDLLVSKIGQESPGPITELETISPALDKYTRYIKCYIGKNAASIGYYSLGGKRMDSYGKGYIRVIYVAQDGAYLADDDTEQLSRYIVIGQDIAPNTEIRFTFLSDSEGNEYSNLIASQTYESITLYVAPLTDASAVETNSDDGTGTVEEISDAGEGVDVDVDVSEEITIGITLENFNKINSSMTYEDVCQLFGAEGELLSDVDIGFPEYATQLYMWYGDGFANCNVMFQGGYMVEKAQVGLK